MSREPNVLLLFRINGLDAFVGSRPSVVGPRVEEEKKHKPDGF